MGIVNITPDSFSDGGVFLDPRRAASQVERLAAEGAAVVDVGGESTRPGSGGVAVDEELRRLVPALERIAGMPAAPAISVDTAKSEVARRAIALGAVMVNDVTALRHDPELAGVVADSGAYLCLMHMLGEPRTMQDDPRYEDVVSDVCSFLERQLERATALGVPEEHICVDPGIGFGKTVEHNLTLLAHVGEIAALGRPVLVGASRKRFLGRLLGDPAATRGPVAASIAAALAAFDGGAAIFRVHDVREHVQALAVAAAVERARAVHPIGER
jgi:dihydropteroate synthase